MLLLYLPTSPLIVALIQVAAILYARQRGLDKPAISVLTSSSFVYGFIGAGASLLLTISWMVWYEYSSGYSAGNGPVGWMLFYGPLSFAIGQSVALVKWWSNAL